MAPNFSKNAILEGTVDFFCLVCDTYLKSENDTELHIVKPFHQKQLNSFQYVEEFTMDKIWKINQRYFCELCNKLFTVLPRVKLHVKEPTHNDYKNIKSLRRVGNCIVALGDIVISEQSWNGLSENSCAVCNTEYEDQEIHKNQSTHILAVMQKRVKLDQNRNIYRTIDEYSFQCLTCNMVLLLHTLTSHFDENEHKKIHQACCDIFKTGLQEGKPSEIKSIKNESKVLNQQEIMTKSNKKCKENDKKSKQDGEPLGVIVQKVENQIIKKEQAPEENDQESLNNKNNREQISNNIQKTKLNENNTLERELRQTNYMFDEQLEETICKKLGTENFITRDENGNTWCILCDWVMNPSDINAHIYGKHHQTILKMHNKRLEEMKNKYNKNITKKEKDFTQILDSIEELEKNEININFETITAVCKKCSKNLEFDYEAINIHISKHKTNPVKKINKSMPFKSGDEKVSDRKKSLFTKPVFLKRDNCTSEILNKREDKGLESNQDSDNAPGENIEQTTVNAAQSLKIEPESIVKNKNKKQICEKPKLVDLKKIPIHEFVEIGLVIEYMFHKDIIINNKFCINVLAFNYLTLCTEAGMMRCQLCDVDILSFNFDGHISTPKHRLAVVETPIIINEDSEFIREVRSGNFHCGFCNLIVTSWTNMETHLKTHSHTESKTAALWRTEMGLLKVAEMRSQRPYEQEVLLPDFFNKCF